MLIAIGAGTSHGQTPVISGNGPYVAPSSVAYADLTNAANRIWADIKIPDTNTVVIYDAPTFAAVPYYQSALDLMKNSMQAICKAEGKPVESGFAPRDLAPIDLGSAASGLASLIGVTMPNYAIQGQALPFDSSALLAAFAAATPPSIKVVFPSYLLPATERYPNPVKCGTETQTESVADLWSALAAEARQAANASNADKPPLAPALAQYGKLHDAFVAADKNPPLLAKLLIVEAMGNSFSDPNQSAKTLVLDVKLDLVGVDSISRTILWWRKTRVSANVLAHYYLFQVSGTGTNLGLTLKKLGTLNIFSGNIDPKKLNSVAPAGCINDTCAKAPARQ